MTVPFIVCASVTAISAIISLGYAVGSTLQTVGQARSLALYACARSIALALVSVTTILNGLTGWLQAIASAMIIVQACDAVIGVVIKDRMKTFGPAATAVANLAALVWLLH